ncbi:class I SAM-dependent methyltransferase [Rhizobium sp. CFBP 8752]|uniref:class I SAM-dependent methyltransferase n=1 Tax=Rhizobium sp. CFBP 8752 TaxID=2775301 RepID=UPI0013AE8C34|nr:class I SAM-dependent methyltransferase [Rhizobium sp. CFBP 8752]MBD8664240.1 class I SAM-dependent methyltransferase [Rhizobium sp. CFBP 8752]
MSRIYSEIAAIDTSSVKSFFNRRASVESNPINAVMLQKEGSTIAIERDRYEREHLVPSVDPGGKVLELGCGAGRLASHYNKDGNVYLGLDFSENLIGIANAAFAGQEKVRFQVAEIPWIIQEKLPIQPPFDLVIVTGLLIYLNDEAVAKTFELINSISARNAKLYLRETISIRDDRLTLRDFYSEELKESYSAVYRTRAEIVAHIDMYLTKFGFTLTSEGVAFPASLQTRAETNQHYFNIER